jgi:hypothetical protein
MTCAGARACALAGALLAAAGCMSFGPVSVDRDRFDYAQAIASSWKQQTLFNIVKLRYADAPVFLEVGQVISGYQLEGAASIGGSVNGTNVLNLGTAGRYVDRPTIVYSPLTGAHFLKVIMAPIPPPALFLLVEAGWPVDLLMRLGVQTINGISNRKAGFRGRPADPEFVELVTALRRIQASGAVGLRVEVSKETRQEGLIMRLGRRDLAPEVLADLARVRTLLRLPPGAREFRIVYGSLPEAGDAIAIQTCSGFQVMIDLGADVEVPAPHVAGRRTYAPIPDPAGPALEPLVRILSGRSRPDDAYATIRYEDHWYWIDCGDFQSKGIFTFLMVTMTLAEKEEKPPPPVVTIPAN